MEQNTKKECTHKDQINKNLPPKDTTVCEDCVKTGDTWVSLRMCLTDGHVGCCDSSKNQHARKHFEETNHAIMKSVGSGQEFTWCYVDDMYI